VINESEDIRREIKTKGILSQRMLQSYFLNINLAHIEEKFINFLNMPAGSLQERRFVAVEKWLNSGADVPAQLALDILENYFIKNKPKQFASKLPSVPVCLLLSTNDQIVARDSANNIKNNIASLHTIETQCGHVGLMVGSKAEETVWRPYLDFINSSATQQR
jgi:polyhydroxyalkanoate synthase